MTKTKKKRNKSYQGANARVQTPVITRVTASNRSAPHQWLHEHKQFARPVGIALAVVFVLVLVVSQIIALMRGA